MVAVITPVVLSSNLLASATVIVSIISISPTTEPSGFRAANASPVL